MKVLLNIAIHVEHPEVSGTVSLPLQLRFDADGPPAVMVDLAKELREIVAQALRPRLGNERFIPDPAFKVPSNGRNGHSSNGVK